MVIKIHLFIFTLTVLLTLTASSLVAKEEGSVSKPWSVKQAISYALRHNSDLASFERNIDIANENIDLARSGYRPSVSAVGAVSHLQSDNNISDKRQSDTEKSIGVNLEQPLFRGGQTVANINEQENVKQSVVNQFTGIVHDKIIDVVAAYMATYTANEAQRVNSDNVELLKQQSKATVARFDAGELTKTDVAQSDARLAEAKAQLAAARSIYEDSLATFREETGITDDIELIYPEINNGELPSSLDSALSMGLRLNPDMNAAMARVKALGYDINEQEGAFYPQLSLGAGVSALRNPAFSQFTRQETANISLNASLPIYQAGVLRNQLRQSKIRKLQSMDEMESTRRAVINEIISAWEQYKAISIQVQARDSQVNASELAYQGVKLEEQVGARSILDVLNANQDVRDAELSLIEAKEGMVNAYYQLLSAAGLLNDSLWDKF